MISCFWWFSYFNFGKYAFFCFQEVFVHPQFSRVNKFNDIALLELQNAATLSSYISPTCLYTDEAEPPPNSKLYVSGWGVYNYTTKETSNRLLKARMKIVLQTNCVASYSIQGYQLRSDHLCASDPDNIRDACWGDSGGPLIQVIDESTKNFRTVGIIISGYGCATAVPGLYTRVSSYLDFIENIVWPEG